MRSIVSIFIITVIGFVLSCGKAAEGGWWCHGYVDDPLDPKTRLNITFPMNTPPYKCEGTSKNGAVSYRHPDKAQQACIKLAKDFLEEVCGYGLEFGERPNQVDFCAYFKPTEAPPESSKLRTRKGRAACDLDLLEFDTDTWEVFVPEGCVIGEDIREGDTQACQEKEPEPMCSAVSGVSACVSCAADMCCPALQACMSIEDCVCRMTCEQTQVDPVACEQTCGPMSLGTQQAAGCFALACAATAAAPTRCQSF